MIKSCRLFLLMLAALLFLPTFSSRAQTGCELMVTETVAKVKDAILNARTNCPDVGDPAKEFEYVRTYDGSGANVTRKCSVTPQDDTFPFSDGAETLHSITTNYFYLITEDSAETTGRPEVGLYTKKDTSTGFFNVSFQIFAGSISNPIATCTGILDETETDTFTDSVIECVSDMDMSTMSFGKDSSGTWCR